MTALATALETAQQALAAAEAADFTAARELLAAAEAQGQDAAQTYGNGNAAHAQRRAKIARVQAAALALLPAEVEAPAEAAPTKKVRGVAPAHALSADDWTRVAAALQAAGTDAAARAEFATARRVEREERLVQNDRFGAKVAEREALQAEVEAAALAGDVDAANAAWDRLFDVCTAIRSQEGIARRAGKTDPVKVAAHEAARDDAARIRRFARA